MRFSTREDIEAPIEAVFDALTDFAGFERAALQRGAQVWRTRDVEGAGAAWTVEFEYRGKSRRLETEVERFERPSALVSRGRIGGFEGTLGFGLVALSPRRTRLTVDMEVKPRSLGARLLLQSMRLAKANLAARFRGRVRRLTKQIERRVRA